MNTSQRYQQVALGLLGLFVILAILIKLQFSPLMGLDRQWLAAFHASSLGQHVRVWEWLTLLGSPLVTGGFAVILALFLWRIRQLGWAAMVLTALISGDALLLVIKTFVARPRPTQMVVVDTGYSFPSGHVFSTMLVAMILATLLLSLLKANWLSWTLLSVIALGVLGVILARLGLRNHYPSDAMGSALLASGWWFQVLSIFERLRARRTLKLSK
ncbi:MULTISPECIES: phosphatase PAP2 family protein [Lactobacillaceae]|uniref:phosphatase PAP2 family protein n=1 Tax=Lactobacillaceae TaxID=33958 RepID=UPI0014576FBD|nr:phosphatase PAP2 family protein [Lactobacillus sp. HBUAS51381]NLR10718.1 phosphatase PAP2 family protein [Lactobacillus sp. HBUAS51381]